MGSFQHKNHIFNTSIYNYSYREGGGLGPGPGHKSSVHCVFKMALQLFNLLQHM